MITVAYHSSELATRVLRPARVKASTAAGVCASLVSISRWPPGASHSGAAAATSRSTSSPSAPPSRVDRDAQAAELRPAKNVFQRLTGGAANHPRVQLGRRPRGGDEQPRLVLGEDAAGRAQPIDDPGFHIPVTYCTSSTN